MDRDWGYFTPTGAFLQAMGYCSCKEYPCRLSEMSLVDLVGTKAQVTYLQGYSLQVPPCRFSCGLVYWLLWGFGLNLTGRGIIIG